MRQLDEFPLDPEIAAQLDAIDATLAGEPVDPEYAELAELALLVTVARPQVSAEFAAQLDDRVQRRFAPASPSTAAGSAREASQAPAIDPAVAGGWGLRHRAGRRGRGGRRGFEHEVHELQLVVVVRSDCERSGRGGPARGRVHG